ncbi:MAG: glucosylglycerol hydrolase [Elainellaceae cyanobacterium]
MNDSPLIQLAGAETQGLLDWADATANSKATYLQISQQLARRLGAHYRPDGLTEIGFWTPGLTGEVIQTARDIYLEIFTPLEPIDFRAAEQTVTFRRDCVALPQQGEFLWGVISGLRPGRRDQAGSLYWLRFRDNVHDSMRLIRDVIPESLPYGVFGPAEVYDIAAVQQQRADLAYFQQTGVPNEAGEADGAEDSVLPGPLDAPDETIPRVPAPVNILQIHVNTGSKEGTLEGLTRIYRRLSEKLAAGEALTPEEQNYVGYDAVQLLPIEPTIEYRLEEDRPGYEFFEVVDKEILEAGPSPVDEPVRVTLRKPDTQNWGYDVPILGAATTNPAVLGSLRPDELIDFIATLHNFHSGPIQVIYDLVYGHADNQSLKLISRQFLKGPNMYGQDLNHQLPMVRALLLEMQRRKHDTGADGIRIDGGQDFRFFNPLTGRLEQDDAYLLAMSDVVQEIGGYQRRLFTIFEDGRPWPEEGWEETSTYRDLVELRPDSYQWGPLIFAHNTPALQGFWDSKWRRVTEVMFQGDRWITGCGNHDTVRRGNQISTTDQPINWNLGDTLPEVLHNAYDNPATQLWVYGFSPGLPMDFLNTLMHSPWGFFRNTDEVYGVKVASEEAGFLDWQISPKFYSRPDTFKRLKDFGLTELGPMRQFMRAIADAMVQTDYDLDKAVEISQKCLGDNDESCQVEGLGTLGEGEKAALVKDLDVDKLKAIAMAFMEDGHDVCRVSYHVEKLSAARTDYNLKLRKYRKANAWLGNNLTQSDRFNRISDEDKTLFYGLRTQPMAKEAESDVPDPMVPKQIAFVCHMGGEPMMVTLGDWLQLDLSEWKVALTTPGLELGDSMESLRAFELKDMQGVLLESVGAG